MNMDRLFYPLNSNYTTSFHAAALLIKSTDHGVWSNSIGEEQGQELS